MPPCHPSRVMSPSGGPSVSQLFCVPLGATSCLCPAMGLGDHGQDHGVQTPGARPGKCSALAGGAEGGWPAGPQGLQAARRSPGQWDRHPGPGTDMELGQSRLGLPEQAAELQWPLAPGTAPWGWWDGGLWGCWESRAGGAVAAPSAQRSRLPPPCSRLGELFGSAPGAGGHRGLGDTVCSGGGFALGSVLCHMGLPHGAAFHHQLQPTVHGNGHGCLQGDMGGVGARVPQRVSAPQPPPQPTSL